MPEIPDVQPDQIIQSAWGNDIRDRTVLRYPSMAELVVGEPTPVAGRVAFIADVALIVVYDGSEWESMLFQPKTPIVFGMFGSATVKSGAGKYYALEAMTLTECTVTAGEAPTGASLIIDVNVNGSTIYTTQGNRPTIAAGGTVATPTTPDITAVAAGDIITVDIDQAGSGDPGIDIVAIIGNR